MNDGIVEQMPSNFANNYIYSHTSSPTVEVDCQIGKKTLENRLENIQSMNGHGRKFVWFCYKNESGTFVL